MRENLDRSLELMFGHEGGYVNVATDKGGPTKFGITLATLAAYRDAHTTAVDVEQMSVAEATAIAKAVEAGLGGSCTCCCK